MLGAIAGKILKPFFRARVAELTRTRFLPHNSLLDQVLLAGISLEHYRLPADEQVKEIRRSVWGADSLAWHRMNAELVAADPQRLACQFKLMDKAVSYRPAHVCELGTGFGYFIFKMRERLPEAQYIGLDINEGCIVEAISNNTFANVSFCVADSPLPFMGKGTLVIACGVLEFFPLPDLEKLLAGIKASGGAVGICEPVNLDLSSAVKTRPRGNTAYSHNYPLLMREAGLSTVSETLDVLGANHYQNVIGIYA